MANHVWIPLVLDGATFRSLRKRVQDRDRMDICDPLRRAGHARPAPSLGARLID
jgi:hypothetical protein